MGLTIGIVANEPSGDQLGALLLRALREQMPDARFVGVAGPLMQAEGCKTLMPLERLSVMGLVEVLRVLPDLLRARAELLHHFLAAPPDLFIGVDAPDFNLGLERRLRAAGIVTVHLVSPTVWAWRAGRVRGIRRAVDLMLSIFPFEAEFLQSQRVPVRYIGHPLADAIPLETDQAAARAQLGQSPAGPLVALLPGSRRSEVERLAAPLLLTALACHRQRKALRFIAPMVSPALSRRFDALRAQLAPALPLQLVSGQSRTVITAADLVLTASGTATLETLLLGRPMLIAYRMHPLTWWLVKDLRLVKVPYAAMANLLVGRELAPEFIQGRCDPRWMAPALLALLDDAPRRAEVRAEYARVHRLLRRDAARTGAAAILELIAARARPGAASAIADLAAPR